MKIKQLEAGLTTIGMIGSEYGKSVDQIQSERVEEAEILYVKLKEKADKLGITVAELRTFMSDQG